MDTVYHDPAHDQTLVGVVRVGKRSYAVNLIWNTASDQKMLAAEARDSATRVQADFLCLYQMDADTLPQYGLGDAMIGHRRGLPSLAAAVGAAVGGSLYGVWQVEDGTWVLLGIRADASVVYDKAFEEEEHARAEFYDGLATEPWGEITCPESWQVETASPSEALSERVKGGRVKLRAVRANLPRIALFAVLALVLLAGGAFLFRRLHQAPPPMPFRAPPPVKVPPMPWVGEPLPSDTLLACVNGLWAGAAAAAQIPGWAAGSNGKCDGKTVSYGISRAGGSVNWVKPMAAQIPVPPAVNNLLGDQASLSWQLPALSTYPSGSPGIEIGKAEDYLRSNFAELQLPLTISPGVSMQFWKSFKYQFSTDVSPDTFTPLLGKIPGSVIRSVSFDSSGHHWSVSGEVYQQLPPPVNPPGHPG